MKWDILLFMYSLLCLLYYGSEWFGYLNDAEVIAPKLAPALGVSAEFLRRELETVLGELAPSRTLFYGLPILILVVLCISRLIWRGRFTQETRKGSS